VSAKTPFFNFQQGTIAAPQATPPPSPVQQPNGHAIFCDLCDTDIAFGEQAIELYEGIAGHSQQTGLPAIVPLQDGRADLHHCHAECLIELAMQIKADQADDMLAEMAYQWAEEMFEDMKMEWEMNGRINDPRS
jgi:hypothetical protein